MRTIFFILFISFAVSNCFGQNSLRPDCSILKSLLGDTAVRNFLSLDSKTIKPVIIFDPNNIIPDCHSICILNRLIEVSHDDGKYKSDCKCSRFVIANTIASMTDGTFIFSIVYSDKKVEATCKKKDGEYIVQKSTFWIIDN